MESPVAPKQWTPPPMSALDWMVLDFLMKSRQWLATYEIDTVLDAKPMAIGISLDGLLVRRLIDWRRIGGHRGPNEWRCNLSILELVAITADGYNAAC